MLKEITWVTGDVVVTGDLFFDRNYIHDNPTKYNKLLFWLFSGICIGIMITQTEKKNIYDWRARRQSQGWKYLTVLLPPDIKSKVISYKHLLMKKRERTAIE